MMLSAEQFLVHVSHGCDCRAELVQGQIVMLPLHGGLHGATCSKVGRTLGNFLDREGRGTLAIGAGIVTAREPDTVRGPDISYWTKKRLQEIPVGYVEIAPDMLVEVLSPSNTFNQIREKVKEYFKRGVRLVWVIAPEDRTLTIYRTADEGRVLHETAVVAGEDVLSGFECRVSDLLR